MTPYIGEFFRRADLTYPGVKIVYYAPDHGSIIKRKEGWYATNDTRRYLVGVEPNDKLVQPTLGPFSNMRKAYDMYEAAWTKIRNKRRA